MSTDLTLYLVNKIVNNKDLGKPSYLHLHFFLPKYKRF